MGPLEPATTCPVCAGALHSPFGQSVGGFYAVDCQNCGRHRLTYEAAVNLRTLVAVDGARPRIAHAVCRTKQDAIISAAVLESMHQATRLPGARERIDNLLLLIAEREPEPGEFLPLNPKHVRAALGCVDAGSAQWVMQEAQEQGLIRTGAAGMYALTAAGWQQHEALLRRGANSTHAFMAMDFNDAGLLAYFTEYLQPAVAQAGFELRTTEHPGKTADLIDNRIRVDLRTSRFVVCDLTHGNRGAYWEAGFAEGVGRPVFYICRHDKLKSNDKAEQPHFDAAHQTIVAWDPKEPAAGADELKAMIRATLPAEARMEDVPAKGTAARLNA